MTDYALLEIGLHRHDATHYRIEPSLWLPGEDADRRPPVSAPILVELDLNKLGALAGRPTAYGEMLSAALFTPPVRDLLTDGRQGLKKDPPVPLRLRLYIGPSAPELHRIFWETLRDPHLPGALLTTNDNIPFSRYLSSWDWHPVRPRPKGVLRALVVVADPESEADDRLPKVDVAGEVKRARAALGNIPMDVLCRCEDDANADLDLNVVGLPTVNQIIGRLREGIRLHEGYDILYLACHGKLVNDVPLLWLEDDQGKVDRVSAEEEVLPGGKQRPGLVLQINQLDQLPRLIVLASCESAGTGMAWDEGAFSALGPRLAEAGVPAVLAMQGSVSMQTVAEFIPVFFSELIKRDGQIDRALAYARATVLNNKRPDWWMPVLFTRLRSGRLWYRPRFADEEALETWPDLLGAIGGEECTPILGPGLIEFLFGSPQQIALRWAEAKGFPMAPHNFRSLPHVARYLATMQSPAFPSRELARHVRDEIRRRHQEKLQGEPEDADLEHLIRVVGAICRQTSGCDAHHVLAQMPIRIYITANPDNLLFDALQEAGKNPQVALCPWNDRIQQPDSAFRRDPDYQPSVKQPLIYHLFGRLSQPRSLVISEDDYFDFLIWVSQDRTRGQTSQIPLAVSEAWSGNALLFLGFQIDDWVFRVLLHSIADLEGGTWRRPKSVAVQVDPEEGQFLQPSRAAKYLQTYLAEFRSLHTNVYWGSAQDFVADLWARRDEWR
jgi:hypothetical protein